MFNLARLNNKGLNTINESLITLDRNKWDYDILNHSFFVEACQFCEKTDLEMYNLNTSLYRNICESAGNDIVVQEAFEGFWDGFKTIIKKIVDFLHALINKFWTGINMILSRESFIRDHEKDLRKFNENHKFTMSIFNFTMDNNIPVSTAIYDSTNLLKVDFLGQKSDYSTNDSTLKDFVSTHYTATAASGATPASISFKDKAGTGTPYTASEIERDLNTQYSKFKDTLNEGDFYDKIRGMFLDKKGTRVDSVDYSKELFEAFRDGQSKKEDHEFESMDIDDAYDRFKRYKDLKKTVTKQRSEAEKEYKRVEKEIEKMITKAKDGKVTLHGFSDDFDEVEFNTGNASVANKLDVYLKAISSMVHEVGNLHSIAFGARLDAYKDCFKQDKQILYSALYRILGNISTGIRRYSKEGE